MSRRSQSDAELARMMERIGDPNWAVDRTGVPFLGVPHLGQDNKRMQKMMPSSARLQCPNCRGDKFYILCSKIDEMVQFRCGNASCSTYWYPAGLHKPQMTDAVAKSLGIFVPEVVPDGRYQELEGWEDGNFTDLTEEQERNRR